MYELDCWKNTTIIDTSDVHGPITLQVPARFDFIGGWTDTPPYHFSNIARVLNATLELSGGGEKQSGKAIVISVKPSASLAVTENNKPVKVPENNLIISKTFEFLGLEQPDISLSISNTIPKGSGLGGSSLLVASLLTALWGYYKGVDYIVGHLNELINNVLLIEQFMESGGGWQDQVGGLFPGVKLIETTPENPCHYTISYLEQPCDTLNRNSLIIDTRIQRKASNILFSIRQKYVDGDTRTITVLRTIAENARLGFDLLVRNDIHAFAELLSDSWRIVNDVEYGAVEVVDEIKTLCGKDLLGMKIGGAGGGGFILAIFSDEDRKEYYMEKIRTRFPDCLIYKPVFGGSGLAVTQDGRDYHIGEKSYV